MFDTNAFKKSIKEWIQHNPQGTIQDLVDYAEDQIPPQLYSSHKWLIEQTTAWYQHILVGREAQIIDAMEGLSEEGEEC